MAEPNKEYPQTMDILEADKDAGAEAIIWEVLGSQYLDDDQIASIISKLRRIAYEKQSGFQRNQNRICDSFKFDQTPEGVKYWEHVCSITGDWDIVS